MTNRTQRPVDARPPIPITLAKNPGTGSRQGAVYTAVRVMERCPNHPWIARVSCPLLGGIAAGMAKTCAGGPSVRGQDPCGPPARSSGKARGRETAYRAR